MSLAHGLVIENPRNGKTKVISFFKARVGNPFFDRIGGIEHFESDLGVLWQTDTQFLQGRNTIGLCSLVGLVFQHASDSFIHRIQTGIDVFGSTITENASIGGVIPRIVEFDHVFTNSGKNFVPQSAGIVSISMLLEESVVDKVVQGFLGEHLGGTSTVVSISTNVKTRSFVLDFKSPSLLTVDPFMISLSQQWKKDTIQHNCHGVLEILQVTRGKGKTGTIRLRPSFQMRLQGSSL
mmetsp:Transcript_9824/g.23143  ORF Transcript_9824/g.23143 Transcript_9824/m.23143 type:complete len:237 (+) Transcript_9824:2267-2977(+)